ncbi:hypothetical protein JCGZ_17758 [Jatropha curcas]|uniref:Uncharacterized protein n=1 Tax=Jatropha curcas TaxID=180498 RepID=A0A067K2X2_JATCU|nr:hypothetical protein JCGZ_17758 [Jatropha curcas]
MGMELDHRIVPRTIDLGDKFLNRGPLRNIPDFGNSKALLTTEESKSQMDRRIHRNRHIQLHSVKRECPVVVDSQPKKREKPLRQNNKYIP